MYVLEELEVGLSENEVLKARVLRFITRSACSGQEIVNRTEQY